MRSLNLHCEMGFGILIRYPAGVAQLVELQLPKLMVVGSNLIARFFHLFEQSPQFPRALGRGGY